MKASNVIILFIILLPATGVIRAENKPDVSSSQLPPIIVMMNEAIEREDAGDLIGAIEVNQKILKTIPKSAPVMSAPIMNAMAGLYGKLGNFEEEIVWAKKAISADPQFSLAYINYGLALSSIGRIDEAQVALENSVRLAPKEPFAYYNLGVLKEQQGNVKAALELYKKSTERDPKFEAGYFNLGAMYANLGQFDKAIAALKKAIELNPNAENAKAMLAEIEKVKQMKK